MKAYVQAGQLILLPEDISNAVLYVLGTPPHVQVRKGNPIVAGDSKSYFLQVHELTIKPVGEKI